MKIRGIIVAVAILLAVTGYAAEPVKVAGSGASVGAIELLITEFRKLQPDARFGPAEAVGTGGAVRAAIAGGLHLALASRPLTEAERAGGASEIEYARTPFVLVVRTGTPVEGISRAQLAEIYAGKMTRWPAGTRVRPVLRAADDIDILILKSLSAGVAQALEEALKRPGMVYAATDREAADIAEKTPGAIAASTLGLVLSESRTLKVLRLDGIEPSIKALESGQYPLHKRLFVVHGKQPLPETAKRFITFLDSAQAKALLARTGHLVPPFTHR